MTDNQQPSLRTCRKCGDTKPLNEFAKTYSKKSRGKNYRQHTCQECFKAIHAARQRKARKENPELYRAIQRKSHRKNSHKYKETRKQNRLDLKIEAMNAYGGAFCACCGETVLSMLTFDHINEDGAEHRREIGVRHDTFARWLKDNGYPDGFQVLCYNCNIGKHRNGGVCPHQEGSTTISKESTSQAIGDGSA